MKFSTFGPLHAQEWTTLGLDKLFSDAEAAKSDLSRAMGVYIIVTRDKKGKLTPWYVGKTDKGFRRRLTQHLKSATLQALFTKPSITVQVFLIARVTNVGRIMKMKKRAKGKKGLRSIDILELSLIGSCLNKNIDLINAKNATFHRIFHVPGYWNSLPKDYDAAASELALMVGIKSGI